MTHRFVVLAGLVLLGCSARSNEAKEPAAPIACAAGTRESGEACVAIVPDCPSGTIGVPNETACRPVGVQTCGKGFAADDAGGCNAILPTSPCAVGTMAIPGETSCRAIAPCGAGRFGDVPVDAATLYVDAAYAGGSSDGSESRPFVRIQDAIAAADPTKKPIVAIAAGTYDENVDVDRPVRLWGRCPAWSRFVERARTRCCCAATRRCTASR